MAVMTKTRNGAGFWLIAGVFLTAMAFSTVPAPLYPIYQQQDGFSSFTVTVVFAMYAVGVVASLLLAGHVSDWVGRRPVLLAALAFEFAAGVLFLVWPALPGLLVARLLTGLGVGMVTATATAYLLELHAAHRPDAGRGRFELVSAAANLGGLGTGTLVAGALAQFAPAPLRTPYAVFLVLLALSAAAVVSVPETVTRPEVAPRYRPQRIRLTPGNRLGYVVAAGGAFTALAILGIFTSLAPGFVAGTLHHPSRLLAGAVAFLVFAAAAGTQAASGRLTERLQFTGGVLAQGGGVLLVTLGMATASLPLFLLGGAVAGAGAGVLFKYGVAAVAATAAPETRGEALAGLFLIGYLGLVGPSLALGVATRTLPAVTAMSWFTGALLLVLAGIAGLSIADRRRR